MGIVKKKIFDFFKGNFLISEDSFKNWQFILFIVFLMMLMIASSHSADRKVIEMASLNKEIKELRAEFVDTRSTAMKIKLESSVRNKVEGYGIFPSENPPEIIKVTINKN